MPEDRFECVPVPHVVPTSGDTIGPADLHRMVLGRSKPWRRDGRFAVEDAVAVLFGGGERPATKC